MIVAWSKYPHSTPIRMPLSWSFAAAPAEISGGILSGISILSGHSVLSAKNAVSVPSLITGHSLSAAVASEPSRK